MHLPYGVLTILMTMTVLIIWTIYFKTSIKSPPKNTKKLITFMESDFPIAFSLRAYQDEAHFVKLLQAIYQPQNQYCIHISRGTTIPFQRIIANTATMFGENVFLVPEKDRLDVNMSKLSHTEADLICAKLLLKRNATWHYWINLDGTEYPLKTNWELATALKVLNGSNLVDAKVSYIEEERLSLKDYMELNIQWMTGKDIIAVRREFIQFAVGDELAEVLLDAFRAYEEDQGGKVDTEESYFATLNSNPRIFPIPGSIAPESNKQLEIPVQAENPAQEKLCGHSGVMRNKLCQWRKKDLPMLKAHPYFFAKDFDPDSKENVVSALEQWHREKLRYEVKHRKLHPTFDPQYYVHMEVRTRHQ